MSAIFATRESVRAELERAVRKIDQCQDVLALSAALEAARQLQEITARSPLCHQLAASIAEVEDRKRRHPP